MYRNSTCLILFKLKKVEYNIYNDAVGKKAFYHPYTDAGSMCGCCKFKRKETYALLPSKGKRHTRNLMKKKRIQSLGCVLVLFSLLFFGACTQEAWEMPWNPKNQTEPTEAPRRTENSMSGKSAPTEAMEKLLKWRLKRIEEKQKMTENLGLPYERVIPFTKDSMTCLAKREGKWGIVTVSGEVLEDFSFERCSYMDAGGWVELEKDGRLFVYDETGTLHKVYEDKLNYGLESKEGYRYRSAVAYAGGMQIKTILPEEENSGYYGVQYRNAETGRLLYEAAGTYRDVGLFTLPDKTGRAVAIRSSGTENIIYYITAEGCISRTIPLEEGANRRYYDFIGNYTWAEDSFYDGWLRVSVYDSVPGFLMDEQDSYTAHLNVDTFEMVRFPEEYQRAFRMQDGGYATAMAVSAYQEDKTNYYYAVCRGERVLTEEKYTWVEFGSNYTVAYMGNGAEFLDEDGNVLARYADASGFFVNGKMLVYDGKGVFFVDEVLQKCSDYIVIGEIDQCFSRGVVIDGDYYLLKEFAEQKQMGE